MVQHVILLPYKTLECFLGSQKALNYITSQMSWIHTMHIKLGACLKGNTNQNSNKALLTVQQQLLNLSALWKGKDLTTQLTFPVEPNTLNSDSAFKR